MAESMSDLIGMMADLMRQNEMGNLNRDELKAKAAQGDRAAALKLGDLYKKEKNYIQAYQCYSIPAEGGNTEAMYQAAMMAMNAITNQAMKKSDKLFYQQEAIRFFKRAAENGKLDAVYRLGRIYYSDDFISKKLLFKEDNKKIGVSYFMDAAKKSHPQAQYLLAIAYNDGVAMPKSMKDEFFWLRCAQLNGDKGANSVIQNMLHSDVRSEIETLLKKLDPEIARHPEYIRYHHIRQEAKNLLDDETSYEKSSLN